MKTEKKVAPKSAAPTIKKSQKIQAKGARKTATALVGLVEGKGEILVNNKDYKEYFTTIEWQKTIEAPLVLSSHDKNINVIAKVKGGGKSAQSEAVRHGISRALEKMEPELRKVLKAEGFLTRDPRVKERKKPGLRRARRAPQWSKR